MHSRKWTLVNMAVLLVFVGLCSGMAFAERTETFHETYRLEPGETVSVDNTNGRVFITATDDDYVDVRAVKKTREGQDELDKVEIRVSCGHGLSIRSEYLERRAKVSVEYTISVPRDVGLDVIKTTNGSIRVEGTGGDATLRSTNGDIRTVDTTGVLAASTTNGSIVVDNAECVTDLTTTNGGIRADFRNTPEYDSRFHTTNGSVDIAVREDFDADVEFRTTNGKVSAHSFPITVNEMSKTSLKGMIGNGGHLLSVHTTNGSITLNRQ